MTTNIDLKPLSEEVIKQMGYDESNLWLIKIGSVVFGPFETQTLKHYVKDNEHLFENAQASLANETKWKPFWSHTKFERRRLEAISKVNSEDYDGPFWIIDFGLKTGPFTFVEIDKKIEMGLLGVTDHISIDNGNNWIKVYQIRGFDRRARSPEELPVIPFESSFHSAEEVLKNKIKSNHQTTITELADITWQGIQEEKTGKYNLEEMNWKKEHSKFGSFIKWAIPGFVMATVGFCITSILLFSSFQEQAELTDNSLEKKEKNSEIATNSPDRAPASTTPLPDSKPKYRPSSTSEFNSRPETHLRQDHDLPSFSQTKQQQPHRADYMATQRPQSPPVPAPQSRYPTQVISHSDENNQSMTDEPAEQPEGPEPSLISNEDQPQVPPEVDMPPTGSEVMEEASDF